MKKEHERAVREASSMVSELLRACQDGDSLLAERQVEQIVVALAGVRETFPFGRLHVLIEDVCRRCHEWDECCCHCHDD